MAINCRVFFGDDERGKKSNAVWKVKLTYFSEVNSAPKLANLEAGFVKRKFDVKDNSYFGAT